MGVNRGWRRGILIIFEGVEGSGKTTQLTRLAKRLREDGHRVVETREPGGTARAERIRDILLDANAENARAEPMAPASEALLILAGRSQHVTQRIQPALRDGAVVLCDRFSDSTFAYQGYGRGLSITLLRRLNRFATHGVTPDLTLLFDLPVSLGLARRRRSERKQNRLDHETQRFHEKVRQGFLKLAARHSQQIKVINARPDPETVAAEVDAIVRHFLAGRRKSKVTRRRPIIQKAHRR